VEVAGLPLGLQVLPGHPTTARVRLDKVIERTRPVQVIKLGEPAEGFAVDKITLGQEEVKVSGATSIVARVARVVVVVDVSGLNSDLESEAELEARDLRDVVVTGVNFEPPRVKVQVEVRRLNTRTVPVRPILGSPPGGYDISWVRVSPPVVTLTGSGDRLAQVDSVSTSTVDISGLRSRKSYAVAINVPEGVSVVGAASVTVTVAVHGQGGTPTEPEPEEAPTQEATAAGDGEGTQDENGEPAPGDDGPNEDGDDEEPTVPDGGTTPAPGTDDDGSETSVEPAPRGAANTN